jgi:RimJ/RimL family protein N-acetyltransferase
MPRRNHLGQEIGPDLPGWRAPAPPPRQPLSGRYCRLEPLEREAHLSDLFAAFRADREDRIWTYLPYGPFQDEETLGAWVDAMAAGDDPLFFAIRESASGRALGVASFLRIAPEAGCIEVGHINYAPALQRTPAATEAMFLMMRLVFEGLGYRRYEWKCDALNAASRRAAERLGFVFEGVFRQATIYKGRNRDTAWFSVIDKEWPAVKAAFEAWLAPANFDREGGQRKSLGALMAQQRS